MLYGFLLWIVLTLVVLGIIGYRHLISLKEDDIVHLAESEAPMVAEQQAMAARLGRLDHWSRRLTMVDVAFGLGLALVFALDALRRSGLL